MNLISQSKKIENNALFKYSRFFLISLLQTIFFSIFLSLILISSFNTSFNTPIPNVSLEQQQMRAIAVLFGFLFLMTFIWIIINSIKNQSLTFKNKIFIYLSIIPLISFINIFLNLYFSIKNKVFFLYLKYIFQSEETKVQEISVSYFFKHLFKEKKNKRLFKNTALFLVLFLVTLITFIFVLFPPLSDGKPNNDPFTLWYFGKFSYFTEWTNTLCFIFCLLFLINHRWRIFKYDLFLHMVSIYIAFVFLIFWIVLTPGYLILGEKKFNFHNVNITGVIFTLWFHLVTPVMFIAFSLVNAHYWKKASDLKISNYFKYILIYPLMFGFYAYTLPFIANLTIYGLLTNANPNNKPFGDSNPGEYWHFVFVIILFIVFLLLIWGYYKLVEKIMKKSKYNNIDNISNLQV